MNTSQRSSKKTHTSIGTAIGWSILIYTVPFIIAFLTAILIGAVETPYLFALFVFPTLIKFFPIGIGLIGIGIYLIEKQKERPISAKGYRKILWVTTALIAFLTLLFALIEG